MKWPTRLNIKGEAYKVKYLDKVICSESGEKLDGTCDREIRTLEITKCEPRKQLHILLHEIGHAVEAELEIEAIRDDDSRPYEVHLLIEHTAKEIVRNWDKLKGLG